MTHERSQLAEQWRRLAFKTARGFWTTKNLDDLHDLESIALMALCTAAVKWDSKSAPFPAFAKLVMTSKLLNYVDKLKRRAVWHGGSLDAQCKDATAKPMAVLEDMEEAELVQSLRLGKVEKAILKAMMDHPHGSVLEWSRESGYRVGLVKVTMERVRAKLSGQFELDEEDIA